MLSLTFEFDIVVPNVMADVLLSDTTHLVKAPVIVKIVPTAFPVTVQSVQAPVKVKLPFETLSAMVKNVEVRATENEAAKLQKLEDIEESEILLERTKFVDLFPVIIERETTPAKVTDSVELLFENVPPPNVELKVQVEVKLLPMILEFVTAPVTDRVVNVLFEICDEVIVVVAERAEVVLLDTIEVVS